MAFCLGDMKAVFSSSSYKEEARLTNLWENRLAEMQTADGGLLLTEVKHRRSVRDRGLSHANPKASHHVQPLRG